MDAKGNGVSSTQTINNLFGSGVTVEGTGIVLNDEMDDFSIRPGTANLFEAIGGEQNKIEPGKRPLSSMSPTIVLNNRGVPALGLGSPSGTRIISCVALTLLNHLAYGLPLYESVAALRYHHQWAPDEIRVDPPGFHRKMGEELREMGHKIQVKDLGCKVNGITTLEGDGLVGVTDPRGEGRATGR